MPNRTGVLATMAITAAIAGAGAVGVGGAVGVTDTPSRFVDRLFAVYRADGRWWRTSATERGKREAEQYRRRVFADFYDPSLTALFHRTERAARKSGDVILDDDPVCQCQDSGGVFTILSIGERAVSEVAVQVREAGSGSQWTLVLTRAGGRWRLIDVVDASGSLQRRLSRIDDCIERARTKIDEDHCE